MKFTVKVENRLTSKNDNFSQRSEITVSSYILNQTGIKIVQQT